MKRLITKILTVEHFITTFKDLTKKIKELYD